MYMGSPLSQGDFSFISGLKFMLQQLMCELCATGKASNKADSLYGICFAFPSFSL